MTLSTLQTEIEEAVPRLLDIARELTYSEIPNNCKFILSEIKDNGENFYVQAQMRKTENDKKIPVTLSELFPTLLGLYHNFYDINLHIYKAMKNMTILDLRYYPKSSLDPDYQLKVVDKPPMLHCKVAYPPWLSGKKEKFDINWEHFEGLNRFRLFWLKIKLKISK
jgi:hypothetical protein